MVERNSPAATYLRNAIAVSRVTVDAYAKARGQRSLERLHAAMDGKAKIRIDQIWPWSDFFGFDTKRFTDVVLAEQLGPGWAQIYALVSTLDEADSPNSVKRSPEEYSLEIKRIKDNTVVVKANLIARDIQLLGSTQQ